MTEKDVTEDQSSDVIEFAGLILRNELYTKPEVIKILNTSERSLDRWLSEGRIKCIRLPTGNRGSIRFTRTEIIRFLGEAMEEGETNDE